MEKMDSWSRSHSISLHKNTAQDSTSRLLSMSGGRRWTESRLSSRVQQVLFHWQVNTKRRTLRAGSLNKLRASVFGSEAMEAKIRRANRQLQVGKNHSAAPSLATWETQASKKNIQAARNLPAEISTHFTGEVAKMVDGVTRQDALSLPQNERGIGEWKGKLSELTLPHQNVYIQDFRREEAYTLPGNDDYRKNVDNKLQALEQHLEALDADGVDVGATRQKLWNLRDRCLESLERRANLDREKVSSTDSNAVGYVESQTKEAALIMGHFLTTAVDEMRVIDDKFSLKQLRSIEQQINGKDCGQNLVTIYEREGRTIVETAIPKQAHMQVSSVRNTDSVPNFYYRASYIRDEDTGALKPLTGMYMHSSLPAIGIGKTSRWTKRSSATLERETASRLVLDKVLQTMAQDIADSRGAGEPLAEGEVIPLPISAQTLFTPVLQDERVIGTASERLQLKLTEQLYDQVNGRKIPQQVQLANGDEVTVYIQPDIEHLNLGTNREATDSAPFYATTRSPTAKAGLTGLDRGLQDSVNHLSWIRMSDDVKSRLDSSPFRDLSDEKTKRLTALQAERERFLSKRYRNKRKKVEQLVNPDCSLQRELALNNRQLDSLRKAYQAGKANWELRYPSQPYKSSLENEYKRRKARVVHLQNKVRGAYSDLLREERRLYKKSVHVERRILAEKRTLLALYKNQLQPDIAQRMETDCEMHQTFLEMQDLYFSTERGGWLGLFQVPKYTKAERNHSLQSAYLHMASLRGRIQVVMCKSTEDRSGMMDIQHKQRLMTKEIHGKMPRFSEAVEESDEDIKAAYQEGIIRGMDRGVDRQVCERMDPGCGYFQLYGDANPHIRHRADIGRAAATLAKRPYKAAV